MKRCSLAGKVYDSSCVPFISCELSGQERICGKLSMELQDVYGGLGLTFSAFSPEMLLEILWDQRQDKVTVSLPSMLYSPSWKSSW